MLAFAFDFHCYESFSVMKTMLTGFSKQQSILQGLHQKLHAFQNDYVKTAYLSSHHKEVDKTRHSLNCYCFMHLLTGKAVCQKSSPSNLTYIVHEKFSQLADVADSIFSITAHRIIGEVLLLLPTLIWVYRVAPFLCLKALFMISPLVDLSK